MGRDGLRIRAGEQAHILGGGVTVVVCQGGHAVLEFFDLAGKRLGFLKPERTPRPKRGRLIDRGKRNP